MSALTAGMTTVGDLPVYRAVPSGEGPWPALVLVHEARTTDRLLERRPDRGVEVRERGVECLLRHAQARGADAVELLAPLEHGLGAALVHVLDDGPHGVQHALDVDGRARQHVTRVDGRAPEVDAADHAGQSTEGGLRDPPEYWPASAP